ncbi:hypothetical protein NKDENANG_02652 [Candidatus Entotheonellaceae bacterium PAL068K]
MPQEHHQAIKEGGKPVFRKLSITYKGDKETYYSYCKTHHMHSLGKHRLVINHRKANLSDAAAYFISNKPKWLHKLQHHVQLLGRPLIVVETTGLSVYSPGYERA